jgi:hypothetical protein
MKFYVGPIRVPRWLARRVHERRMSVQFSPPEVAQIREAAREMAERLKGKME